MAAGAGDHLMLNRLGLGEDNAEKAGSSTLLLHESVVSCGAATAPSLGGASESAHPAHVWPPRERRR